MGQAGKIADKNMQIPGRWKNQQVSKAFGNLHDLMMKTAAVLRQYLSHGPHSARIPFFMFVFNSLRYAVCLFWIKFNLFCGA